MAKKKSEIKILSDDNDNIPIELTKLFDDHIMKNYGDTIAPPAFVTPFGIKPFDAISGGGIMSSGIIMCSSTPETGKSTLSYQFVNTFLSTWEDSFAIYIDIEGTDAIENADDLMTCRVSRIETFGIDTKKFKYYPVSLDMLRFNVMIKDIVKIKNEMEKKRGTEIKMLIVWDSLSATPSSRSAEAETPQQVLGRKAQEISLFIDQCNPLLKFNRITMFVIDQTRANMKLDLYAKDIQGVGNFGNVKSASSIYSLNHAARQWYFLYKGKKLDSNPTNNTPIYGSVDGYELNVYLEKSKMSPSSHIITCIFDKNRGISKFWTEMHFLTFNTPEEDKLYKGKKSPEKYVSGSGAWYKLKIEDNNNPEKKYESKSFYFKDAEHLYNSDDEFKQWFDYAVDRACQERLINGIMNMDLPIIILEDGKLIDITTGELLNAEEPEDALDSVFADAINISDND